MLAANEAVAFTLDQSNHPVLYRIHEKPDPEKVNRFLETTTSLGHDLPPMRLTPAWFADVLQAVKDEPAEYVVNNLLLRTMQQARYAPDNLGHFGLAAEYYLHFTSPIRRYPDLVAHRSLQMLLLGKKAENHLLPATTELTAGGLHLSRRERIAVDVERNVQARLAVLFLQNEIGREFEAIISGVTSFGLFVELLDYFISGAIPIADLSDDYYIYDGKAHQLTGELSGARYGLGNLVRVRLEHTDILAKRITFSLVTHP
jgi:ribonuclease R